MQDLKWVDTGLFWDKPEDVLFLRIFEDSFTRNQYFKKIKLHLSELNKIYDMNKEQLQLNLMNTLKSTHKKVKKGNKKSWKCLYVYVIKHLKQVSYIIKNC